MCATLPPYLSPFVFQGVRAKTELEIEREELAVLSVANDMDYF